ncbi:hypothetical protein [uncultured Alistipes sp.]|nr:hypothetical protein [uncultured Alistipes sp.]
MNFNMFFIAMFSSFSLTTAAVWKPGRRFGGRESAAALRGWVERLELD